MPSNRAPTRPLATPAEVAEFLSLDPKKGPQMLAQMRYLGTGPRFIKIDGHKVRYRWSDVEAWLEARTHTRTDDHLSGVA